jgi:hypothetical protein
MGLMMIAPQIEMLYSFLLVDPYQGLACVREIGDLRLWHVPCQFHSDAMSGANIYKWMVVSGAVSKYPISNPFL